MLHSITGSNVDTPCSRVSRKARPLDNSKQIPYPYNVAVEAIAESALVTWIGLIIYGISSLAPEGRFTVSLWP